ncbi:MAG: hypothetical protein ACFE8A_09810 [Candidatus Hodarchaeota archaeon]
MFHTDKFGTEQVYLNKINKLKYDNIIKNKRVRDFMNKHNIGESDYGHSSIDILAEEIRLEGIETPVLFSVEVWELHNINKRHRFYNERIYIYDKLKKILYEEGFIDIHIVLETYKRSFNDYQKFIIRALKKEVKEKYGIELDMEFPRLDWSDLVDDLKTALDHQLLDYWY